MDTEDYLALFYPFERPASLTGERPVLVLDFHSLSPTLQMLLAFLLTDDQRRCDCAETA